MLTEYVQCSACGKQVSTPVPKGTVIRAWIECPECIESRIEKRRGTILDSHSGGQLDTGQLLDVIETLELALDESIKLQSHYAELLNMHDGGQRIVFADSDAWIERLDTGKAAG